jgi:hypothetical protein
VSLRVGLSVTSPPASGLSTTIPHAKKAANLKYKNPPATFEGLAALPEMQFTNKMIHAGEFFSEKSAWVFVRKKTTVPIFNRDGFRSIFH